MCSSDLKFSGFFIKFAREVFRLRIEQVGVWRFLRQVNLTLLTTFLKKDPTDVPKGVRRNEEGVRRMSPMVKFLSRKLLSSGAILGIFLGIFFLCPPPAGASVPEYDLARMRQVNPDFSTYPDARGIVSH